MATEKGLVITRKVGEGVVIDNGRIIVRVNAVKGKQAQLRFVASRDVVIHREEIQEKIQAEGTR